MKISTTIHRVALVLLAVTTTVVHGQNGTTETTNNNGTLATPTPGEGGGNATTTAAPTTTSNGTTTPMETMEPNATGMINGTTAPPETTETDTDMMVVTLAPMEEEEEVPAMNHSNIFDPSNNGGGGTVQDEDENRTEVPVPAANVTEVPVTLAPTPAVENSISNQLCSQLKPGDVFIYVVESDDPDGIGFLALEAIPASLELLMTDNPWVGYDFIGKEGVVKLEVPSDGIRAGEQFGFGFDFGEKQKWEREDGVFNFGTQGDSVFLYCLGINGTINPLVGFSNNNAWAPPGLDIEEYGSEKSALPPQLQEVGAVVLPHLDNWRYEGPELGDKSDLQKYMMDPDNWQGSDEGLGDQPASDSTSLVRHDRTTTLITALGLYLLWQTIAS